MRLLEGLRGSPRHHCRLGALSSISPPQNAWYIADPSKPSRTPPSRWTYSPVSCIACRLSFPKHTRLLRRLRHLRCVSIGRTHSTAASNLTSTTSSAHEGPKRCRSNQREHLPGPRTASSCIRMQAASSLTFRNGSAIQCQSEIVTSLRRGSQHARRY
jgi:hypothetical protein